MSTFNCRFEGETEWDCMDAPQGCYAAEQFAYANENEFTDDDERIVEVEDEDGLIRKFTVTIDREVRFDAYPLELEDAS